LKETLSRDREPSGGPGPKEGLPDVAALAAAVYLFLFLAAVLWLHFQDRPLFPDKALSPLRLLRDAGIGAAVAVALVFGSWLLSRLSAWARDLEVEFKKIFGDLRAWEIGSLALLSGFVEELLFRGAMQPVFGIVLTSLIFGLLHVGPGRVFWPWTLLAVAMGFLLGWLREFTGAITAPVVVHVGVNLVNLARINAVVLPAKDAREEGEDD
jgi:membrane protease YdiL (CAAX protease family)